MPRNKTLSELWPSKKDPAYYGQMRNQVGEKEVERRDGYSLREQKVVDYTEKEETYINDSEDATADEKNKEKASPYVICPVCWSSLEEEKVEVFSLGCGHLVCGGCGEGVVVGGRGCPVCRNREAVLTIRRIYF